MAVSKTKLIHLVADGPTHVEHGSKVLGGVDGNLVVRMHIFGMQAETFEGGIAD